MANQIPVTRTNVAPDKLANRSAAKGGVVAGLVGGLVLSIFMAVMNLASNKDVWAGMKFAALPLLGSERVMQPGFEAGPVLLGLLCHFAVSVVWGLLFGMIFYGLSKRWTIVAGVFWGIAVWLGMFYAVLPIVGAGHVAASAPMGMAILQHVLFGICVAFGFLPFQHQTGRPSIFRRSPVMPGF